MGFIAVDPGLHQYDNALRALTSDQYRVLHEIWLREPRHWLGVSRFRPVDILPQLPGDWTEKRVQECVSALRKAELVLWDPEAKLIFVRAAQESDRTTRGERSVLGVYQALRSLPDVPLLVPALQKLAPAMRNAVEGIKKGENIKERRARLEELAEVVECWAERLLNSKDAPSMDHARGIDGPYEGEGSAETCPMDAPSMDHGNGSGAAKEFPGEGGQGEKILPKNGASMDHLARAGDRSRDLDQPPPKGGSTALPGRAWRWLGRKGGQDGK